MIVMNLSLRNIYGFSDFKINFSYPKKIVNSLIENEYMPDRPFFRYKKAVILMGANATGKTSLGKALLHIFKFLGTGNTSLLFEMVPGDSVGQFTIDFVNEGYTLHRVSGVIDAANDSIILSHAHTEIEEKDTYEKCAERLVDASGIIDCDPRTLKRLFGELNYRFAYPEIETSLKIQDIDRKTLLRTLKAVIGTLDPTLTDVSESKDLRDSYIIRRKGTEIIIQEGKLLNKEILSSGTAEGIDIAIFLASILSGPTSFYYCDEHFSYIQTDIEKRIFAIMLDHLKDREQLIFTTHNTDMLDLNLPKHSFAFLHKRIVDGECQVGVTFASEFLKRNTASVRCAVENDMFSSLPDDSLLNTLEKGWVNEE